MKFLVFLILLVLVTYTESTFRYAHSPKDLQRLANLEKDLFVVVKKYVAKLENESEYFYKRYIADYENSSLVGYNDWKRTQMKTDFNIHNNPLWSHRMIWRFVTYLPKIYKTLLSTKNSEELASFQNVLRQSFVWPTERDLNDSISNLLNMHHVYSLNLADFSNGIIVNVVTNASLSAIHCFEVSRYALSNNQITLATIWLKMAKKKHLSTNRHPILDHLDEKSISKLFDDIMKQHDIVRGNDARIRNSMVQYFNDIDSEYTFANRKTTRGDGAASLSLNDIKAFSTLCQGDNLQPEKEKSQLYCWYESKVNSAWYINPQKIELHSKDPYLIQVYDFIGPELIKYITREAISLMVEPTSKSSYSTDPYNKIDRGEQLEGTSIRAKLEEHLHEPRLPALSRKLGYLTGLTTYYGQPTPDNAYQITASATGAHFITHVDTDIDREKSNDNTRDRLASYLFYLNDVELGGNTAFTSIGVAAPPVKGSILFWPSVKYNGKVDYRTYHGGCPVLLGERWVATKVIHNGYNVIQRPCSLNKDE